MEKRKMEEERQRVKLQKNFYESFKERTGMEEYYDEETDQKYVMYYGVYFICTEDLRKNIDKK